MKPFATTLLASVLALASHRAGAAAPMPSSRTTPSASVVAPVKAKSSADGSALTNVGIGLTVTGLVLGGAGTLALLEAHQEDSLTSGVIAGGCYVLGGISLITGVTLWVVGASADQAPKPSARIVVAPSQLGVVGHF